MSSRLIIDSCRFTNNMEVFTLNEYERIIYRFSSGTDFTV